jgi:hypothetical protein
VLHGIIDLLTVGITGNSHVELARIYHCTNLNTDPLVLLELQVLLLIGVGHQSKRRTPDTNLLGLGLGFSLLKLFDVLRNLFLKAHLSQAFLH